MLSEALDITIESRGDTIWLILSGPFNKEQIPNIRTKIEGFIQDGNRWIVVNLEAITFMHEDVAPMFLNLLNFIKGKNGDIKLIFKNDTVYRAFARYKNIFSIYPDSKSMTSNVFLDTIRQRGIHLTKKTGIRVSIPVALFLLFILTGWFISLGIIINMQKKQIIVQEEKIRDFQQWKHNTNIELNELKNRIKPMEQLGLLQDSLTR